MVLVLLLVNVLACVVVLVGFELVLVFLLACELSSLVPALLSTLPK